MKKIVATILSLFTVSVAAFAPATGFVAQKSDLPTAQTAITRAAEAQTATDICTAVQEGYAAISHGNTLYLFSDDTGVWQEYSHAHEIVEMRFADDGVLYFLDKHTEGNPKPLLHRLNANAVEQGATAENTGIFCNAFFIDGENLYHTYSSPTTTSFYRAALPDPTQTAEDVVVDVTTLSFTLADGSFYFTDGITLYGLSWETATATQLATLPLYTKRIEAIDGVLYGVTKNGEFYGYSLADLTAAKSYDACTPVVQSTENHSGLSANGDTLYLMQGSTPYLYSTAEKRLQAAEGAFSLPLVTAIPTGKINTELSALEEGRFSVVTVKQNALMIEVDLRSAQDDGVFPYLQTHRTPTEIKALRLSTVEEYALLDYRKGKDEGYATLVHLSQITENTEDVLPYTEEKTGYLTNAVSLYKYPTLGERFPRLSSLTRGTEITLLGEVTGLDRSYYKVRQDGTVGYIPKSYVTLFNGSTPAVEQVLKGDKTGRSDAVWRLAYLVLGAAAICILIDILILRKKSEEE